MVVIAAVCCCCRSGSSVLIAAIVASKLQRFEARGAAAAPTMTSSVPFWW